MIAVYQSGGSDATKFMDDLRNSLEKTENDNPSHQISIADMNIHFKHRRNYHRIQPQEI